MYSIEEFHSQAEAFDFKDLSEFPNNVEFSMYLESLKSLFNIPSYIQTVVLYLEWGTDHTFERITSSLSRRIVDEIRKEATAAHLIKVETPTVDIMSLLC